MQDRYPIEASSVRIPHDGDYRDDGIGRNDAMSMSGTVCNVDTDWLRNIATVVFTTGPERVALTFAPQRFGPSGSQPHPFEALLSMDEGDRVVLRIDSASAFAMSAA